MSKSVFVVMTKNFEYTDEYYYSTEGGDAVKAFVDRESAEEAVAEIMLQFFKDQDPSNLVEYFAGANGQEYDDAERVSGGTIEQKMAYAEEIGLGIAYVVEVKVEIPQSLEDSPDFSFED